MDLTPKDSKPRGNAIELFGRRREVEFEVLHDGGGTHGIDASDESSKYHVGATYPSWWILEGVGGEFESGVGPALGNQ